MHSKHAESTLGHELVSLVELRSKVLSELLSLDKPSVATEVYRYLNAAAVARLELETASGIEPV